MAGMQKYCKSQKAAMKLKNINLFEGQIGSTGNTAPTGTKENDIFSLLKMTNLI